MIKTKPKIIDYFSADIENVWTWEPNDLTEVYFTLEIEIASDGDTSGQIFQMIVATPDALKKRRDKDAIFSGRGLLITVDYNWQKIEDTLNEILEKCAGDTWEDIVQQLLKFFWWEYENHMFID